MNRKFVLLIVLTLVLTGALGFSGVTSQKATAASTFQRVNFVSGVVTATELNVRQGPSTNFPVVCVLKKGQTVKVFGKLGDWYAVYEPASRCVGAVSSQFIKPQGTTTKAPAAQKKQAPNTTVPKQGTTKQGTPGAGAGVSASPSPMSKAPSGIGQDEQLTLDLINKERANAGIEPLKFDMELVKVAELKAKDMVEKNYFSHQSPTYGSPFDMMRQFNVDFRTAGENIAGNRTVEGAVKAWMASEGHRKNILNGNFNYTGIGVVDSPTYGKMFVQMFIGK
ncbi:MAG: CAP domain-containing protein [Bacillota bacterium]